MTATRQEAARDLPHDVDTERAVLSTVLVDPTRLDEVGPLSSTDFYADAHVVIWTAILDLAARGDKPDAVSVAGYLNALDRLGRIGGTPYLANLTEWTPYALHVAQHARVLRALGRARRLIQGCRTVATEGTFPQGDWSRWLDTSAARLAEITVADPSSVERSTMIGEAMGEILSRRENPDEHALAGRSTGFPSFDALTGGLVDGELHFVGGRPGAGKTSAMLQIALHDAEQGNLALFLSVECDREVLANRALAIQTEISLTDLRSCRLGGDRWQRVADAVARQGQTPLVLRDKLRRLTPRGIRDRIRAEARAHGRAVRLVVVDYLQLLAADGHHQNRVGELEEITRELKLTAQEFGCTILCASSLNREGVKGSGGGNSRPQLSDLRGCGSVEFDGDLVWFVHRDDCAKTEGFDGEAEWLVRKGRNSGPGVARLQFKFWCTKFAERAP